MFPTEAQAKGGGSMLLAPFRRYAGLRQKQSQFMGRRKTAGSAVGFAVEVEVAGRRDTSLRVAAHRARWSVGGPSLARVELRSGGFASEILQEGGRFYRGAEVVSAV